MTATVDLDTSISNVWSPPSRRMQAAKESKIYKVILDVLLTPDLPTPSCKFSPTIEPTIVRPEEEM